MPVVKRVTQQHEGAGSVVRRLILAAAGKFESRGRHWSLMSATGREVEKFTPAVSFGIDRRRDAPPTGRSLRHR
jgi:hypothetical protein